MNRKDIRNIVIVGLVTFIILGFPFGVANAQTNQEDLNEKYKNLINGADGVVRSIRLSGGVSENKIENLESLYSSVFPDPNNETLDTEIRELFSQLKDPETLNVDMARELRDKIEQMGNSEGVELPFVYKYSIFIILGVSFGLSITVNTVSRIFVDWEEVNAAKRKQNEIKDKLNKARKEGDSKKVRKYQKMQQKFMQEHMGTMFSPMKTSLIIFIPFIIVFRLLSSTYGGWVVAWLPFNLPWPDIGFPLLSRFFKGTVASLGFFGWYLLCYFGLSQLFRKILVPSE